MIALLLNAVTEHYQAVRGASADLVHVTLVEEAHRLLARSQGARAAEDAQAEEKAAEAFANTLAENRKYGEGAAIIAEQLPTKLVQDAVENTNLKIMHRLTAEDDRRYLGQTMGFDEPQMRFATRLQTGEALVYSDEFAEATHVTVTPALRPPRPARSPRCPWFHSRPAIGADPSAPTAVPGSPWSATRSSSAASRMMWRHWRSRGWPPKISRAGGRPCSAGSGHRSPHSPRCPQPSQPSATQRTACSCTHSRSAPCATRHRGQRPWRPGSTSRRSLPIGQRRHE